MYLQVPVRACACCMRFFVFLLFFVLFAFFPASFSSFFLWFPHGSSFLFLPFMSFHPFLPSFILSSLLAFLPSFFPPCLALFSLSSSFTTLRLLMLRLWMCRGEFADVFYDVLLDLPWRCIPLTDTTFPATDNPRAFGRFSHVYSRKPCSRPTPVRN